MMNKTRIDWIRWGAILALIAIGWFQYEDMFYYTIIFIKWPVEDMSHAWVVPFVSLYAIWHQKDAFRQSANSPSWRGFVWFLLFLVVAWFGARGGQARIQQVSLIGLIWSIPYTFWGKGIGRLMLFPAWFLLFTVPVSSYLDFFTVHLRILSSSMATEILNGFGMAVERSGTAIFSRSPGAEFSVDVADPCSGIRSLFAMMTLTAAYAHFRIKAPLQRWMLFACSIPIAVLGNMFRIFSICLVAVTFGQETATGLYHDYSGYVIFLFGILLICGAIPAVSRLNAWLDRKKILPEKLFRLDETPFPPSPQLPNKTRVWIMTGLVCGLVILTFQSHRFFGVPTVDTNSFLTDDLPHHIDGYTCDRPWFCQSEQCNLSEGEHILLAKNLNHGNGFKCPACNGDMQKISGGELKLLPKDTEIQKRIYRAPDGTIYSVSVVLSGRNRSSIHRAELCLPAQGFVMLNTGTYPLNVPGGKPRQARIINAQRSSFLQQFSLAYWFINRERECTSHAKRTLIDIWDRSIHNRINRWAMVAVNVSVPLDTTERIKAFEIFLDKFYPQIFRDESHPQKQ